MKSALVIVCTLGLMGCAQGNPVEMDVKLYNAAGDEVGKAHFSEQPGGMEIKIKAEGFEPGPHGLHVHAVGECKAPTFQSSGEHFNVDHKEHGLLHPKGPENGDLPNVIADDSGKIDAKITAPNISFKDGKKTLYRKGGASLIMTEQGDDGMTQPAGNGGKRIVCGVITKKVKGYEPK